MAQEAESITEERVDQIQDSTEVDRALCFYLEYQNSGLKNQLIPLEAKLIIGREHGDSLINHPSISNNHCTFFLNQGVASVIDNGSTNGTYIGTQKIRPGAMVILEVGDTISLGQIELKLVQKHPAKVKDLIIKEGKKRGGGFSFDNVTSLFSGKKTKVVLASRDTQEEPKKNFLLRFLSNWKEKQKLKKEEKLRQKAEKKRAKEESKKAKQQEKEKGKSKEKTSSKKVSVTKVDLGKKKFIAAGPVPRILALFIDVFITVTVIVLLSKLEQFQEIMGKFSANFQSQLAILGEQDQQIKEMANLSLQVIPYVWFFYLMSLFSVILLKVTPGQYLVGLRSTGGFLWGRLGGLLRTFIDMITGPILILDLPCLFKRKTFKEFISFTGLSDESGLIRRVFLMILFFLGIPMVFLGPLFLRPELIQGLNIGEFALTSRPKKSPPETTLSHTERKIISNYFGLQATFQDEQRFILIPKIDVLKRGKEQTQIPGLIVFDLKSNSQGQVRIIKNLSHFHLFASAKKFDPLFNRYYPELNSLIKAGETKWQVNPRPDDFKIEEYQGLPEGLKAEIGKLIFSSLELGLPTLQNQLRSLGPFIYGRVSLREKLLKELELFDIPVVQKVNLGGQIFLRFSYRPESNIAKSDKVIRELFMPIGTKKTQILEVIWDKGEASLQAHKDFLGQIFAQAKWVLDIQEPFIHEAPISRELNSQVAFYLLDQLSSELTESQLADYKKALYNYFYLLSKEALKQGKDRFYHSVISSLRRMMGLLRNDRKSGKLSLDKEFLDRLNNIYIHLKDKNVSYFSSGSLL